MVAPSIERVKKYARGDLDLQYAFIVKMASKDDGYFPEHNLLYGSDLFPTQDGKFFFPQEVTELTDAVKREHLQVDRFSMMHIGPTPWSELGKAVAAAELQDTPDGVL